MSDDKPKLLSREEAEKLLLADRQRRAVNPPAKPTLMPNTLHPYMVFYVDTDIAPRPVIAWHPNGQPMVVDGERGLLVQAIAIGDVARIELVADTPTTISMFDKKHD